MHICLCRFLKNDTVCSTTQQSSRAAPDYSKAVHLWHPKSPATTTEIMLLSLQISDVCASCSAGTMAFMFPQISFITLLMNCVIILCPCGTENCSCVTAIIAWICHLFSFDIIWIISAQLAAARTLHISVALSSLLSTAVVNLTMTMMLINLQTNKRLWQRCGTVFCLKNI